VGIYAPKGLFEKDFRIEYAHLTDPSWYVHSVYQSGYTYKNRILGHHVGGAGKDLYLEQELLNTNRVKGKIMFDYEERGIAIAPVTERHYQAGMSWKLDIDKIMIPWTIQAGLTYGWIENARHTPKLNQGNTLATLVLIGKI
jgi:hypothetical protein